jgi:hypothetical protein
MHTILNVLIQDDSLDYVDISLFATTAKESNRQYESLDDTANKFLTIYIIYRFEIILIAISGSFRCERQPFKYTQLLKQIMSVVASRL